jgi:uncharacterized membrane protein YvbJ
MEVQMNEELKEQVQDQVSEESSETEEQAPAVLGDTRKKKSVLIPVLIILFIILVIIAGYFYATYSPQIRHISKNALAVAKVDIPKLIKKSGAMKKGEIDEEIISALEV